MRRLALRTIPLGLFGTACAGQPWTPSVPVAYWSQDVPPAHTNTSGIHASSVIARWSLSVNDPWAPYQKTTLATSLDELEIGAPALPDYAQLDVVASARAAAVRLGTVGLPPDTMLVVDLRGAASVAFGAALSHASQRPVSLVMTFNNWPSDDELVPAEETLAALVSETPASAPDSGGVPIFLLDAWRLAFRYDTPEPGWVDNRYTVSDLPTADVLRSRGIRRVMYVVENLDETEVEEDDLNSAFTDYQAAGLHVSMTDLGFLAGRDPNVDWNASLDSYLLQIQTRPLITGQSWFYQRAHGGFGGVRGMPSHWGGSWHGGSHGGGHGGG